MVVTKEQQAANRKRVIEFLEKLDDQKFDLQLIVEPVKVPPNKTKEQVQHEHEARYASCGTTACMLGWCPHLFPEYFSMTYREDTSFGGDPVLIPKIRLSEKAYTDFGVDNDGDDINIDETDVFCQLLGLEERHKDDVYYLFMSGVRPGDENEERDLDSDRVMVREWLRDRDRELLYG